MTIDNAVIGGSTAVAGTFTGLTLTGSTIPANGVYLTAANTLSLSARSLIALSLTNPASAVNYLSITGSTTLNFPSLAATGTDTNIGLNLQTKGTGSIFLETNSASPVVQVTVSHTASSVNNINLTGATAGNAPVLSAIGSDTDININITPKGAGSVVLGKALGTLYGGTGVTASNPVIQRQSGQVQSSTTGTTVIPGDNTIPQKTEGDQYMTVSITPKASGNILVIEGVAYAANSAAAGNSLILAIFQDTTSNALSTAVQLFSTSGGVVAIPFKYSMAAGTTSATTFNIRIGCNTAGTTTFNGSGGSQLFGGTLNSYLSVTEYAS